MRMGRHLDVTDFGFSTSLELRKKKFGFYLAPSYMKLSSMTKNEKLDSMEVMISSQQDTEAEEV